MNKYQKAIGSLRWSAELCQLVDMKDVDTLQELLEKAEAMEAALDKACERLEDKDNIMCEWAEIEPEDVWTAAQWKELFMKDVKK